MENILISNLYNLDETIAKPLLEKYEYPWEALSHIEEFIIEHKCAFINEIKTRIIPIQENSKLTK